MACGGLMSLVAYGEQDVYLNSIDQDDNNYDNMTGNIDNHENSIDQDDNNYDNMTDNNYIDDIDNNNDYINISNLSIEDLENFVIEIDI